MKKALCSMLAAMPFLVSAASWEVVSSENTSGTAFKTFEIDTSSVIRRDGMVRVWVRHSFRPERELSNSAPENKYSSYIGLNHFDCEAREYAISHVIYYSDTFGKGNSVHTSTIPRESIKNNLEPIAPGTLGETMLEKVCALAKRQKK